MDRVQKSSMYEVSNPPLSVELQTAQNSLATICDKAQGELPDR